MVDRRKVGKYVGHHYTYGTSKGEHIPTAGVGAASRWLFPTLSAVLTLEISLQTQILTKMTNFQMAVTSLILGVGKNP